MRARVCSPGGRCGGGIPTAACQHPGPPGTTTAPSPHTQHAHTRTGSSTQLGRQQALTAGQICWHTRLAPAPLPHPVHLPTHPPAPNQPTAARAHLAARCTVLCAPVGRAVARAREEDLKRQLAGLGGSGGPGSSWPGVLQQALSVGGGARAAWGGAYCGGKRRVVATRQDGCKAQGLPESDLCCPNPQPGRRRGAQRCSRRRVSCSVPWRTRRPMSGVPCRRDRQAGQASRPARGSGIHAGRTYQLAQLVLHSRLASAPHPFTLTLGLRLHTGMP